MNSISDALSQAVQQLIGRASGPFHLRLVITPTLAIFYAVRAGLKDAREGRPPFLWEVINRPDERQRLRRSWWKDIGKMIIMVLVVDTAYQIYFLRAFHVLQVLILVVALAMLPYAVGRGITTRLARGLYKRPDGPADESAGKTATGPGSRRPS